MKIQINQLNSKSLGFDFNHKIITDCLKEVNSDVLSIFPELSVSGSVLFDATSYNNVFLSSAEVCNKLLEQKRDLIFGTPLTIDHKKYNALVMVEEGEIVAFSTKKNLSSFDIGFDQGEGIELVNYNNKVVGFGFLEDLAEFVETKTHTDLLVICSNSLFHNNSQTELLTELILSARKLKTTLVFCNRAGAEGGYVFSGGSSILNQKGELCALFSGFKYYSQSFESSILKPIVQNPSSQLQNLYDALTIAIKDYFNKNGIKKAILGLSGGIDSALVVALAVRALGKENVIGLLMPSEYSSEHSIKDALDSAENLGIEHYLLPIKDCFDQCSKIYNQTLPNQSFNVADENLQSRLRMVSLMWFANKMGAGLLNTTNKSEAAVGYGTIYGDTSGTISVLADVYKTQVWELAKHINNEWLSTKNTYSQLPIPYNSIQKTPSAELRPGQKDTDSLPDYPILDRILIEHLEKKKTLEEIEEVFEREGLNVEKAIIEKVIRLVKINEWKRRQCPTPVKVSKYCFGLDIKFPIS
jgi:NAD+ synthase (glutamine-hydrolysing)